jgi:hypothetical protein
MRISIDITGADERALNEAAQHLSVPPDEIAAAALREFLDRRDEAFERVAQRVVQKNRDLSRRLE